MKHLSRNNNYRIFLTREDDRFVSLSDRVNFAKSKNADLFISIHADASSSSSTKGFSVYTLSDKGLDKEAEKLAAIENSYAMANSSIIPIILGMPEIQVISLTIKEN